MRIRQANPPAKSIRDLPVVADEGGDFFCHLLAGCSARAATSGHTKFPGLQIQPNLLFLRCLHGNKDARQLKQKGVFF